MKRLLLIGVFLISIFPLFSQISEGGIPPSFAYESTKLLQDNSKKITVQLSQNIFRLKKEDAISEKNGAPARIAVILPMNINLTEQGEWTTLPDSTRICRLTLKSDGALGVLLYYNQFYIPKGDKLFIYDKSKDQLLGAYTNNTCPQDRNSQFSTQLISGDEVTLEYVSTSQIDEPSIIISGFGYGYNHIKSNTKATGFGTSGSCQVNVNCSEGYNWQIQKRGIAKTITAINGGSYLCTGSLINNTRNDGTPYFLSAYHCFFVGTSEATYSTMQFYFDYETIGCGSEPQIDVNKSTKVLVGSQMLITNPIAGGSDGALLKLNSSIPSNIVACYNGWDATNTPATSGVTIHHPSGDVKKISTYTTPLTTGTAITELGTTKANVHWVVQFSPTENGHGTTEGGSSGAPLFNQNGLIVGSLTGGSSTCASPYGKDLFSKFGYNLNQDPNPSMQMKQYLDPDNSGISSLNRYYPYDEELVVSSDTVRLKVRTSYTMPIVSGNGGYIAQVDNGLMAMVDVVNDNSLLIKALNEGMTNIRVKDVTGQEVNVILIVYPEEVVVYRTNSFVLVKLLETVNDDYLAEILVMDMMGRIVSKIMPPANTNSYQLDMYAWPRGAYIVKTKTNKGGSISQKILW